MGEELTNTSKLLGFTYSMIKGNWSLKALKFKRLRYTGITLVLDKMLVCCQSMIDDFEIGYNYSSV